MEQILPDSNISESDPLANVANSSTLIFRTLQYIYIYICVCVSESLCVLVLWVNVASGLKELDIVSFMLGQL